MGFNICCKMKIPRQKHTERDNYMTAQEAKEYGLIDEILAHH